MFFIFQQCLDTIYDKIKTINASEPTYIESMIKFKSLLNMSLKSRKGHLKEKFLVADVHIDHWL